MFRAIWNFVNSQFFIAMITLAVGFTAWILYHKQNKDQKRDLANSILSEIEQAEKSVDRVRNYIRDTGNVEINIQIVRQNSWTSHKHLFSNDLDEDEWNEINNFYDNAELLNETLKRSNMVFEKNSDQIRNNMQEAVAAFSKAAASLYNEENKEETVRNFNEGLNLFNKFYEDKNKEFTFSPVKYLNDANRILEDIRFISTSTAGEKLKKLSGKKK